MNNKRPVIAREPDKNINCATIKEITGGTELNACLNHSNNTKVLLKISFLLECNDKLKLNKVNDALASWIWGIPFKNKFVDKKNIWRIKRRGRKENFIFLLIHVIKH